MAVDPERLDEIAATVAAIYREAETALTALVAKHLQGDLDSDMQAPAWAERKLAAIGKLRRSAQAVIAGLQAAGPGAVRDAAAAAFREGWTSALAELPKQWFPSSGVAEEAQQAVEELTGFAAVEALANAVYSDIGEKSRNILRDVLDVYRAVITAATARTVTGVQTRRQASQAAYNALLKRGITGFTDKGGKRWKLSTYVEMTVRTVTQRAAVQGQTDRLDSMGVDLVMVSNSPQECVLCRPYEGRVLALSGPTGQISVEHAINDGEQVLVDVVATLAEAQLEGLFHPNCRHSVSAYLPGVSKLAAQPTADPEGDKARQQQRAIERAIREAKTEEVAALGEVERKAATRKKLAAQAAMREHLAANPKLKRLPYREAIGAGNIPPKGSTDQAGAIGPAVQLTLDSGSGSASKPSTTSATAHAAATEPKPAPAAKVAPKAKAEPKPTPEIPATTKPKAKPAPAPKPVPAPDPVKPEPKAKPEAAPKPKPATKPEPVKPAPAPKPVAEPKPESKPKVETEPQAKPAPAAPVKPKPAPEPVKPDPKPEKPEGVEAGDFSQLRRVGEQGGSNPGGTYEDADGNRWYVKAQRSEQHAANEVAASALYRAAGIDVPEVRLGRGTPDLPDGPHTASRIVQGARVSGPDTVRESLRDGMGVDAWLANWDIVGANFDNVVRTKSGQAVRIDLGGSLLYRAMGEAKNDAFGSTVDEWLSLRDPKRAPQAAKVFGGMTPAELVSAVARVEQVPESRVREIVTDSGLPEQVADTLIARRRDLVDRLAELREHAARHTAWLEQHKTAAKGQEGLETPPIQLTYEDDGEGGQLVPTPAGWNRVRAERVAQAVIKYRGSGYQDINQWLRTGAGPASTTAVSRIDDAMAQSTLPRAVAAHRGITSPGRVFGASWNTVDVTGLEWVEKGYSSTTVDERVAKNFADQSFDQVIMRLVLPKGARGLRLSDMAEPGEKAVGIALEAEVLVSRDTRYRVVADHGVDAAGIRRLDVEVIDP
ncbi:phage minor capsid protein [Saccharothrix sp. HUAS TT1]|uniref:phage minor capsid protein n=1 Tax=unclassified Saccharothrix TaxID=2593673 RepID=UPI00345B558C